MEEPKGEKTNPGVARYGNFINYYQFNSVEERMSRIDSIPDEFWKLSTNPYLVLDIGCNSGELTKNLQLYLSSKRNTNVIVLGIDIDIDLIRKANCSKKQNETNLSFECMDIMDDQKLIHILEFLDKYEKTKFDAVFCLSITMWIHLNHCDEGLQNFLGKISSISHLILVEPQPWKCYKTAERRLKRANLTVYPYLKKLTWRYSVENDIDNYLQNNLGKTQVHVTEPTKWSRKIYLYA